MERDDVRLCKLQAIEARIGRPDANREWLIRFNRTRPFKARAQQRNGRAGQKKVSRKLDQGSGNRFRGRQRCQRQNGIARLVVEIPDANSLIAPEGTHNVFHLRFESRPLIAIGGDVVPR